MDRAHNVAALVLGGLLLAAIAVGLGSTWIDDGDGTCGAVYRPNVARVGCSGKLMGIAVSTAVLAGCALLTWDAALRTRRRPGPATVLVVGVLVLVVFGLFGVKAAADRRRIGDDRRGVPASTAPPQPRATVAP